MFKSVPKKSKICKKNIKKVFKKISKKFPNSINIKCLRYSTNVNFKHFRWLKAGKEVLNNLQNCKQNDQNCLKEIELADGVQVPRSDSFRERSSKELNQKNLVHSYNNIL